MWWINLYMTPVASRGHLPSALYIMGGGGELTHSLVLATGQRRYGAGIWQYFWGKGGFPGSVSTFVYFFVLGCNLLTSLISASIFETNNLFVFQQ